MLRADNFGIGQQQGPIEASSAAAAAAAATAAVAATAGATAAAATVEITAALKLSRLTTHQYRLLLQGSAGVCPAPPAATAAAAAAARLITAAAAARAAAEAAKRLAADPHRLYLRFRKPEVSVQLSCCKFLS